MKRFFISIGVIVSFLVAFNVYVLAEDDMICGCYKKNNGQLRIVNDLNECLPSEIPISWNKNGSGSSDEISMADLIGTWSCTKYFILQPWAWDPLYNNPAYTNIQGTWLHYVELNITFTDNQDGTLSWTSTPFEPFIGPYINPDYGVPFDGCDGNGIISLFEGAIWYVTYHCCDTNTIDYELHTRILIKGITQSKILMEGWHSPYNRMFIICYKQ